MHKIASKQRISLPYFGLIVCCFVLQKWTFSQSRRCPIILIVSATCNICQHCRSWASDFHELGLRQSAHNPHLSLRRRRRGVLYSKKKLLMVQAEFACILHYLETFLRSSYLKAHALLRNTLELRVLHQKQTTHGAGRKGACILPLETFLRSS